MISSISAQCQETDPAKSSRRPHGDIKLRWPLSPRDERLPSVPFGPLRSARCGPAVLRPRLSAHAASTPALPTGRPAHRTSRGGRNARQQPGLKVRGKGPGSGQAPLLGALELGSSPLPASSSGSAAGGGSPPGCASFPSLLGSAIPFSKGPLRPPWPHSTPLELTHPFTALATLLQWHFSCLHAPLGSLSLST